MFGPHLFDAYVRDGVTGETRPLPRDTTARLPAIYVGSGAEFERGPIAFQDYGEPIFLELTHITDHGTTLPDGIEGRVLERKDDMSKVWFLKRGIYIIHADSVRSQENWGRTQ
jgi:hypothetical protein